LNIQSTIIVHLSLLPEWNIWMDPAKPTRSNDITCHIY